jgi:CheY-like chemotaxis protein
VDDDRDSADSFAAVLGLLGYRVEVAYGGPGAVEVATEAVPDVAVLDLGLPGMDGYELARRLRVRPRGEEVVLIAMTGWVGEPYRRRAREAGFDHFLAKPASLEALIGALGGVVDPGIQALLERTDKGRCSPPNASHRPLPSLGATAGGRGVTAGGEGAGGAEAPVGDGTRHARPSDQDRLRPEMMKNPEPGVVP